MPEVIIFEHILLDRVIIPKVEIVTVGDFLQLEFENRPYLILLENRNSGRPQHVQMLYGFLKENRIDWKNNPETGRPFSNGEEYALVGDGNFHMDPSKRILKFGNYSFEYAKGPNKKHIDALVEEGFLKGWNFNLDFEDYN